MMLKFGRGPNPRAARQEIKPRMSHANGRRNSTRHLDLKGSSSSDPSETSTGTATTSLKKISNTTSKTQSQSKLPRTPNTVQERDQEQLENEIIRLAAESTLRGERHSLMPEFFDKLGDRKKVVDDYLVPRIEVERQRLRLARKEGNALVPYQQPPRAQVSPHQSLLEDTVPPRGEVLSWVGSCMQCRRRKAKCEGGSDTSQCVVCLTRNTPSNKPCTLVAQFRKDVDNQRSPATDGDWDALHLRQHQGDTSIQDSDLPTPYFTPEEDVCRSTSPSAQYTKARDFECVNRKAGLIGGSSCEVTCEVSLGTPSEPVHAYSGTDNQDRARGQEDLYQRIQSLSRRECEGCNRDFVCAIVQSPPEDVQCRGTLEGLPCPQNTSSRSYLERHCGMHPSEVQQLLNGPGHWLCPNCSSREEKFRETRAPIFSTRARIPTKFGRDRFNDQELRQPLDQLENLLLQYVAIATEKTHLPVMRHAFLRLPFLCNESKPQSQALVETFRRLLDVPKGVTMKAQVIDLQLEGLDPADLIRGLLAALLSELMLHSTSPFEDVDVWFESLSHSFSQEIASMIIQDQRRRVMESYTFNYTLRNRVEEHVKRLNSVMFPLMGGNSQWHDFHVAMVEVAENVNATLHSYNGTFEEICPKIGDLFDPALHELDRPGPCPEQTSGRCILWITMRGVRYKAADKDWRICSRAKVLLRGLTSNEAKLDVGNPSESTASIRPRAPTARSDIQSMSVVITRKRQHHDITEV